MRATNNSSITLFFTLLVIIALAASSCRIEEEDCIRGKGQLITEIRTTPAFSSVDLRIAAKVIITQDPIPGVEVKTYNNLQPEIFTYVNGSTLIIDADRCIRNRPNEIEVFIWAPNFSKIRITGSGSIESANVLVVPDIDLHISGSGYINVALNTAMVYSTVSGSGSIFIEGEAYEHNVLISGSGWVESFALTTERCNADISGSGSAEVRVCERLVANISGSGNVSYKGHPDIISTISGSGKVINAN
jgi:hypothetical protein